MKITKKQLAELIKEEVNRQKTLIELKERKNSILNELNEMDYGVEETDEELLEEDKEFRKKKLEEKYRKLTPFWYRKKFISKPTEEKLETLLSSEEAIKDKYRGSIGHKGGEAIYVPFEKVNYAFGTHTYGSGVGTS